MSFSLHNLIFGDGAAEAPSQEASQQIDSAAPDTHGSSQATLSERNGTEKKRRSASAHQRKKRKISTRSRRASNQQLRRSILRGEDIDLEDEEESVQDEPAAKKARLLEDPEEEIKRLNLLYASANATSTDEVQASLNPALPKFSGKSRTYSTKAVQAKAERQIEWLAIRAKWKARTLDLRQEPDVGGAFEYALRRTELPPPRRNIPKSSSSSEPPVPPSELEPDEPAPPVDTSDEEDENILSQLLQGSQTEKEKKRTTKKKLEDFYIPYSQRLDYWELGLTCPDAGPELNAYLTRLNQVLPKDKSRSLTDAPLRPGELVSLRAFRKDALQLDGSRSPYLRLHNDMPTAGHFLHERQLTCLIARHLTTTSFNPACWRLLWHRTTKVSKQQGQDDRQRFSSYHRQQQTMQGNDAQTFWSHAWTDRRAAADLLGVTRTCRPSATVNDARHFAKRHRNNVVKLFARKNADGKAEKIHYDMGTEPQSSYVPVPGTAPPEPAFGPLDVTEGILMGPPDRTRTYRPTVLAVDEATYRLTVASLHRRLLDHPSSTRQHLQAMADKMMELTLDRSTSFHHLKTLPDSQKPLKYRACMGYVSLSLNGGLQQRKFKVESDSFEEAQQSYLADENLMDSDFPSTCSRLFDFLESALKPKGLERMGRLHCVFGLLRIGKTLPDAAARLLSQPLNNNCETPFERLEEVLQYLEDHDQLVEDQRRASYGHLAVGVGELEYALYQAGETFATCVEREPTELQYRCWHLATLAGCLLLCSGHIVGSGARVHPAPCSREIPEVHERAFDAIDQTLSSGLSQDEKPNAIGWTSRLMLPKFYALRGETAKAFFILCHFASKQDQLSSRAHLAVASFLQWHQVVALLLGPNSKPSDFETVRSVHEYHVMRWAYQDGFPRPSLLFRREGNIEERLESLARAVESDPADKSTWRALAEELGPVGCCLDSGHETLCTETACAACALLVEGRYMDHQQDLLRNQGDVEWWGKERCRWWADSVFDLDDTPPLLDVPNRSDFYDGIDKLLSPLAVYEPRACSRKSRDQPSSLEAMYKDILEIASTEALSPEADTLISKEERYKTVDDRLVKSFGEEMNDGTPVSLGLPILRRSDAIESTESEDGYVYSDWDVLEVSCYQIIVAWHLFGTTGNEWVQTKIAEVALACWDNDNECITHGTDAILATKWLYQMGLSITGACMATQRMKERS